MSFGSGVQGEVPFGPNEWAGGSAAGDGTPRPLAKPGQWVRFDFNGGKHLGLVERIERNHVGIPLLVVRFTYGLTDIYTAVLSTGAVEVLRP